MLVAAGAAAGMAAFLAITRTEAPLPAARLVPAETLLLAECPDLLGTVVRWRETDLARMLREPEIQAFLARPLAALQASAGGAWLPLLKDLQPRRGFLALADLNQNIPLAVGGVSLGDRAQAEALLARVRARLAAASPRGRWERQRYGGFQIESFTADGITVCGAFAKEWFFAANDVELLKGTLDRFAGKLSTSLEAAPTYRQCARHLPERADLRLFAQAGSLSERLLTQWIAPAQAAPPAAAAPVRTGFRAAALASRFEGRRLRDTLFLYRPGQRPQPVLNGKTLALTTPQTLFYGALAPRTATPAPSPGKPKLPSPGAIPVEFLQAAALNPPPATLTQFHTAFGPEHALLLNWPGNLAEPGLFLACEIRDPAAARRFVESAFRAWARSEAAGVSLWTFTGNRPEQTRFHPSVALTSRHFLAGLSAESLQPFASLANAPVPDGPTLRQSPAFQTAMATIPAPQTAVAYLDAGPLFERLYGMLRPVILLWGNGMLPPGGPVDFTKLPAPATIARHLSPLSLSAAQTGDGVVIESAGPVTFLELGAGIGGAALAASRSGKATPRPPEAGPRQPMAPLSAPAPGDANPAATDR